MRYLEICAHTEFSALIHSQEILDVEKVYSLGVLQKCIFHCQ